MRDAGFELSFTHHGISVSKNNIFYFNALPRNGILGYMDGVISIDKYVFHVAKRTKSDLNKTFLWHFDLVPHTYNALRSFKVMAFVSQLDLIHLTYVNNVYVRR